MKKVMKLTALLLCVLFITASFSSCIYRSDIEEMRSEHAFWTEKGTILYGDDEYIPLPSCKYLNAVWYDMNTVYVTEADVPVLLSHTLGTMMPLSDDGVLLQDTDYSNGEISTYYCRSDKYDEVMARIETGNYFDGYTYAYFDGQSLKAYHLTKDEVTAVNATLESGKIKEPSDDIGQFYVTYLDASSDDELFSGEFGEIYCVNGAYFIYLYSDDAYFAVDKKYTETFDNIVKGALIEAEFYQNQ